MDYSEYTVEDFIKDNYFHKWVLSPDKASDDFWKSWISAHPHKSEELMEARNFILSLKFKQDLPAAGVSKAVWRNIEKEVFPAQKTGFYKWGMVAAAVVLVSAVAVSVLQVNKIVDATVKLSYQKVECDKKQRKTVLLPDGSKVWLNAESTLRYPSQFEANKREVYLQGEAFFDVVKNAKAPFTVKTDEVNIRVLGTSFNVRSYNDDNEIETTLVTGAVEIDKSVSSPVLGKETVLLQLVPQEKASFSKSDASIEKTTVDTKYYTSWKEGQLLFSNEKLENVAKKMSKWYGVNIAIEDEVLKACHITLKIDKEPLGQVLDLLKMTTPVKYTIADNGDVTIKGNACM